MISDAAFIAALNHLLEKESWARERLAPFAHAIVELRAPPLPPVRLAITEPGLAQKDLSDAPCTLIMTLHPEALMRGQEHFMRSIETAGDADLADAAMLLARHLRWDVEEELSRFVGDIAARRLAQGGRDLAAWQRDAAWRLAESLTDYFVEEQRMLVRRAELESFRAALGRLGGEIDQLERRIASLG